MPTACRFSIIVPVLNESGEINGLLDRLSRSQDEQHAEIIVVDGSPQGDTLKSVRSGGPLLLASPRGRAVQMNAGAAAARGDILLFLHADTQLPPDALSLIENALEKNEIVGGAFDLAIDSDRIFLKMVSRLTSLRARLTRIPYGDQAIFVRTDFFRRLGGYPEMPIMEDVDLMRRIKKAGGRIRLIPIPVITSGRRWEREGTYRGTLRNVILLLSYFLGVSPARLSRFYRSGKDVYGT